MFNTFDIAKVLPASFFSNCPFSPVQDVFGAAQTFLGAAPPRPHTHTHSLGHITSP